MICSFEAWYKLTGAIGFTLIVVVTRITLSVEIVQSNHSILTYHSKSCLVHVQFLLKWSK